MSRLDNACPFGERERAARCQGCMEGHGAMPPCVVAWLQSQMGVREPATIIHLQTTKRRAA